MLLIITQWTEILQLATFQLIAHIDLLERERPIVLIQDVT